MTFHPSWINNSFPYEIIFWASLSPITDYVLLAMRHFMFCYIATALLPWQGFRHTALPFV